MYITIYCFLVKIITYFLDLANKFKQREKDFQEQLTNIQQTDELSEPQQEGESEKVGFLESQLEDLQDLLKSKQR